MSQQTKRVASAFPLPEPELSKRPTRLLAVDPGIVHCGMAHFERIKEGWRVRTISDRKPLDLLFAVREWMQDCYQLDVSGVIVVEGFQLYPGKMQQQGMSRMGTPETIGALKWLYLDECWLIKSAARPDVAVALYEQGASIKEHGCKAMESYHAGDEHESERRCHRVEGKGWVHDSEFHQGHNPHERDAESHGWYRIKIIEATWGPD